MENYNSVIRENKVQEIERQFQLKIKYIGIIFLLSFFFPIYTGKIIFINIYTLANESDGVNFFGDSTIGLILALLPALYGIALLIMQSKIKDKTLSAATCIMGVLPFSIILVGMLTSKSGLSSGRMPLTSFWLLAISTGLIYLAINNISESKKGKTAKIAGLVGAIMFAIFLFLPVTILKLGESSIKSELLLTVPFKFMENDSELLGIVFLVFLVLMVVAAIRVTIPLINQNPVEEKYLKITNKIFISSWLVLFIGIVPAILIDILKNLNGFFSPPAEAIFSIITTYIKLILIILPHFLLFYIASSKLYKDYVFEDENSSFSFASSLPNNSFKSGGSMEVSQHDVQNFSGRGTAVLIIDTGIYKGNVYLNGIRVSNSGTCRIAGLEQGEYRIKMEGKNCYSDEESVFIASSTEPITINLKIKLLGGLHLKSIYKDITLVSNDGIEIKLGSKKYLKPGKYKFLSSIDYLPPVDINIEEGKYYTVDYDCDVKEVKMVVNADQFNAEVDLLNYDTMKTEHFQFSQRHEVKVMPGRYKINIKSGKINFEKTVLLKNEEEYLDFGSEIESLSTNKKKTLFIMIGVAAFVVVMIAFLLIFPSWGENSAWSTAVKNNTEISFKDYIQAYPNGKHVNEANQYIENKLWERAKNINSEGSYIEYIDKYENGIYKEEARKILEPIMWSRIYSENSEYGFEQYLKYNPSGAHRKQAYERLEEINWARAKNSNDIDLINSFISKYPYSKYSNSARELANILSIPKDYMSPTDLVANYGRYIEMKNFSMAAGLFIRSKVLNVRRYLEKNFSNVEIYQITNIQIADNTDYFTKVTADIYVKYYDKGGEYWFGEYLLTKENDLWKIDKSGGVIKNY